MSGSSFAYTFSGYVRHKVKIGSDKISNDKLAVEQFKFKLVKIIFSCFIHGFPHSPGSNEVLKSHSRQQ